MTKIIQIGFLTWKWVMLTHFKQIKHQTITTVLKNGRGSRTVISYQNLHKIYWNKVCANMLDLCANLSSSFVGEGFASVSFQTNMCITTYVSCQTDTSMTVLTSNGERRWNVTEGGVWPSWMYHWTEESNRGLLTEAAFRNNSNLLKFILVKLVVGIYYWHVC